MCALPLYTMLPLDLQSPMRTYPSFDELRLQIPMRCAVTSKSGGGKTVTLMNILLRMNCFQRFILVLKKPGEPMMQWLKRIIESQQQRDPEVELIEGTTCADLPNINTLREDDERNTCLVIDDQQLDPDSGQIGQYFLRGRSLNISIFYLCQRFHTMDIFLRAQLTHMALLKIDSKTQLHNILREYGDVDELLPKYKEIVKQPNGFMLLDLETTIPELKYRDCYGDFEQNKRLPLEGQARLLEDGKGKRKKSKQPLDGGLAESAKPKANKSRS